MIDLDYTEKYYLNEYGLLAYLNLLICYFHIN